MIHNKTFGQTNKTKVEQYKQLLLFNLAAEKYAIDLPVVKEIRNYQKITRIAGLPHFVKGITQVEQHIVLVVDLRNLFELEETNYNEFTLMVILNINNLYYGLVVDEVRDIISLPERRINTGLELPTIISSHYIKATAELEENLLLLLDIEKLITEKVAQFVDHNHFKTLG